MTAVAEASTPTVRQAVRRWRFWGVVLLVVVVVALASLLARGLSADGSTFGPDNTAPAGARALRSVLQQQGVQVDVVTRIDAARSAPGTLLVDDADTLLDKAAWRSLLNGRTRLVVVGPAFAALETVLPGASSAGRPGSTTARAGCALALAKRAGAMSLTGATRSLRDSSATVCFADASGAGQLVTARESGTRVILLADPTPFTNEHIGESGNAAVALNVLGSTDRLTWYLPSPIDAATGTRSLAQLTPPWVTPSVLLLLAAGLAAAFWRGRRLGALVVERLPVTVRSRETVEGRARLYARGSARLRAADSLRIGAIGRIAPMLGLARTASVDDVVLASAVALGRPSGAIRAVLIDAEPGTDGDLVRLSDDLARLEAAVHAATVPGASAPTNGAPPS
jgi:hypothetical protein